MNKPRRYISDFMATYEPLNLWHIKVVFEDRKIIKECKLRFENIAHLIECLNKKDVPSDVVATYRYNEDIQIRSICISLEHNKKIGYYFYIKRH